MIRINPKAFLQTSVIALLVVLLLMAVPALGSYDLSWHTIDGGGGTNSGGQYIVRGTIGQHDAAYSQGGDYEVLGGFWPGRPTCFVDFAHFARFAQYWLDTGTGLPADLYEDENNIVDLFDLKEFIEEWLCYCPDDWPLK